MRTFLLLTLSALSLNPRMALGSADRPIPFAQKLERQNSPSYTGGPVWRAGERVSAPFASRCESSLSLQVAENAPGGVRDIRHADTFEIDQIDPETRALINEWRGLTFHAIVEVVEPVRTNFQISNMQHYRGRIVALEPPRSPINPARADLELLDKGLEVVIIGTVAAIGQKSLTVRTQKHSYNVELWSGLPVLEQDLSGRIHNLNGDDRLKIGDEIQLKAYVQDGGGLGTHWCRTCNLNSPSPERLSMYLNERQTASRLIAAMKRAVRAADWQTLRLTNGRFAKIQHTPTEIIRQRGILSQVPEAERPLVVTGTERIYLDRINDIFGVDVDEMTLPAYLELMRGWARMEVQPRPRRNNESFDESYLFRIADDVEGVGAHQSEIARMSVRHRLNYFKQKSAAGETYEHHRDWDERYNLEQSLIFSARVPTASAIDFLVDICLELAGLEKARWGFKNEFSYKAVAALENVFLNAQRTGSLALRGAFKRRFTDIRKIHDDLLSIVEEPSRTRMTIIGWPRQPSVDPTEIYRRSRYAQELSALYKMMEIIGAW